MAAVRPGFRTAFARAIRAGTPVGAASAPAPLTTPGTNRAASSSTPTKEAAPPAMASASSCWNAAHTMRAVPAVARSPPADREPHPHVRVPSEALRDGTHRLQRGTPGGPQRRGGRGHEGEQEAHAEADRHRGPVQPERGEAVGRLARDHRDPRPPLGRHGHHPAPPPSRSSRRRRPPRHRAPHLPPCRPDHALQRQFTER